MTQSEQKVLVANTAIDTLIEKGKIFSGMKIGLGTGSTAMPAVKRLADHINNGELKDIKAVVTSFQTQNACQDYGIPVYSLNDKIIGGELDLSIDGADEVTPDCFCIKGGGAAHVREKLVEYNSKIFLVYLSLFECFQCYEESLSTVDRFKYENLVELLKDMKDCFFSEYTNYSSSNQNNDILIHDILGTGVNVIAWADC